jgi:hypothetical protein
VPIRHTLSPFSSLVSPHVDYPFTLCEIWVLMQHVPDYPPYSNSTWINAIRQQRTLSIGLPTAAGTPTVALDNSADHINPRYPGHYYNHNPFLFILKDSIEGAHT